MKKLCHFELNMRPMGKERARGWGGKTPTTPTKTRNWEKAAAAEIAKQFRYQYDALKPEPLDGEIVVEVEAMKAVKNRKKWGYRISVPDGDNIEKIIFDSLKLGCVIKEDALLCKGAWAKYNGPRDKIKIRLYRAEPVSLEFIENF